MVSQNVTKDKVPYHILFSGYFSLLIISAFNVEIIDCFRGRVFSSKSNDSQRKSLRAEGEKPGWAAGSVPSSARLLASCPLGMPAAARTAQATWRWARQDLTVVNWDRSVMELGTLFTIY